MEAKLLDCPFCGSKDAAVGVRPELRDAFIHRPRAFAFICDDCLAQTGWYATKEIAARKWNARTANVALRELREAAEKFKFATDNHDGSQMSAQEIWEARKAFDAAIQKAKEILDGD